MTAQEHTRQLAQQIHYQRAHQGRSSCCRLGLCATHLAEDRVDVTYSTLHLGSGLALLPNYAHQEMVAAFARVAVARARRSMMGAAA